MQAKDEPVYSLMYRYAQIPLGWMFCMVTALNEMGDAVLVELCQLNSEPGLNAVLETFFGAAGCKAESCRKCCPWCPFPMDRSSLEAPAPSLDEPSEGLSREQNFSS